MNLKHTAPEDRTQADPTPLRLFSVDANKVKDVSEKTGMNEVEIKRRAIHVGLPLLADALGIDLNADLAAEESMGGKKSEKKSSVTRLPRHKDHQAAA